MGQDCQVLASYPWYISTWADIVGNILYNRGIGFVCYEDEAHASFAKEAMANQSLDMDEILNVRYVNQTSVSELADMKVGNRGP